MTIKDIFKNIRENNDNPRRFHMMIETLILKLFAKYLKDQGKEFKPYYRNPDTNNRYLEYDGYAVDGFDQIEGKTIIEIKSYTNRASLIHLVNNKNFFDRILNDSLEIKNILIITTLQLSDDYKEKILNRINSLELVKNVNVFIWDITNLEKLYQKYPELVIETKTNISKLIFNSTFSESIKKDSNDWKVKRKKHIEDLRQRFNEDDLVVFLGAGISKDAKIPTWDNLVSDLLVSLMSNKLSDYEINLTENQEKFIVQNLKTMNGESPLLQARYIRSGLEDVFLDLTNEILYKNCINSSSLLEEISRLCLPVRNGTGVRSVVTYNFDDLLEYNFEKLGIKYRSIYRESDIPTKNELGIYHVHGFLPRNREDYENISESLLVFSEEEYHNLMLDSYNWSNLIQLNYLRENTCLMIGLSVTDPNLRRLLDIAMRKQEDSDLCKHYVILKMKSISEKAKKKGDLDVDNIEKFDLVNRKLQEEFFKELGLNVIWVEEHKEIPEIIAKIYG